MMEKLVLFIKNKPKQIHIHKPNQTKPHTHKKQLKKTNPNPKPQNQTNKIKPTNPNKTNNNKPYKPPWYAWLP